MKRISAILVILFSAVFANAQTTTFTYQGKLNDGAMAANGTYQMQFELYDAQAVGTGNQIGTSITVSVTVTNGIFTTQLDFGQMPFAQGQDRFLQIAVARSAVEPLTTLEPRQPLTSAPYAIKARIAETAVTSTNSIQLGGVAANQYVLTNDTRMTDARQPLPGSADYIQNGTSQQTSSNFYISGEGKANIFSATQQFNIGANRVLSIAGTDNLFVGSSAGLDNSTGVRNSFVGFGAGRFNTIGEDNSFFGNRAGRDNTTGNNNSFFGSGAGLLNTSGSENAFFGRSAGGSNTTGSSNAFFGKDAGVFNSTASFNSFFGNAAGTFNTTGEANSFFGFFSGNANTTGGLNSFFGTSSGRANTTGQWNSFFGGESGIRNTTGNNNSFFGNFSGYQNTTGTGNSFFGIDAGRNNLDADNNSFFGANAGRSTTTGGNNVFVGSSAGFANTVGTNNTILGANANLGANNLTNATAIGFGATVNASNSLVLGNNVNVGIGTSSPTARLQVSGGDLLMDNNRGLYFRDSNGANKRVVAVDINNILRIGSGGALGLDEVRFDLSTPGTVMTLDSTGNVGIGTTNPNSKLTVTGVIETTTGGIRFPDGTIQTTASQAVSGGILNQTTLQTGANFNIDGTGRANIFNAVTQYNLNGSRVLSNAGSSNLFVGVGAGNANAGSGNTFVGTSAGFANTTGTSNSFFGINAGRFNTQGNDNTFFGAEAGFSVTTASNNSFFGRSAGFANTTGTNNSFFGLNAGRFNTEGSGNTFVGLRAGLDNVVGNSNAFFGADAGRDNLASDNTFLGNLAGAANTTGDSNTYVGRGAGNRSTTGSDNVYIGYIAANNSTTGSGNTFVGRASGVLNTSGTSNSFFGWEAGFNNETGRNNTIIGKGADVSVGNLNFATAIGSNATVSTSNTIVLGRADGSDNVRIPGLGAGGSLQLCRNAANEISTCSSSIRYKTNVADFTSGLSIINRLRPVTFNWTANNQADLGLVAEEVAETDENLIIRNEKGEVEGVKYDRVGVVLVNAVKEQQAQIEEQKKQNQELKNQVEEQKKQVEAQQKQLDEQKKQIELLKQVVCSQNNTAAVCKEEK